ncbi:MAG: T9SS type A sorting domain-containing protein [Prolixibacteraceae bacterium]|nr:T9SS type A sorting domain-containing protein [Prolixibacteraceae bacterium]
MKKLMLIFMFFSAVAITNAQYSNTTLNGPWLLYKNPLSPYNDGLMYIIFDGNGSITDWGGFGTYSGNYSVSATGVISGNLIWTGGSFQLAGQLNSQNSGILSDYVLSRIANPGALSGTITGSLNSACGSASVSLTVDNQGKVTSATGLIQPVSGRIYADLGVYFGHIKTGELKTENGHWNEFSMMGYYSNNTLNGKIRLDAGPNDCISSQTQLVKTGVTNSITANSNFYEFTFVPNPANEIVSINFNAKPNEVMEISIFNLSGSMVKSEMLKQNQWQINIEDLSNGIYLLSIRSKNKTVNKKLIIQR